MHRNLHSSGFSILTKKTIITFSGLKTSPEETELKLYLLLFLAPDWSKTFHRRLFVQSAFNHFESDSQPVERRSNSARHSHFNVGPAHQHRLRSFRTYACMILRRLCKSCFYV